MARPPKKAETVRLNLEISPGTRDRLERLQKTTEARSMVEVISWALAVYERLVNQEAEGNEVLIRRPNGKEQGLLLAPT